MSQTFEMKANESVADVTVCCDLKPSSVFIYGCQAIKARCSDLEQQIEMLEATPKRVVVEDHSEEVQRLRERVCSLGTRMLSLSLNLGRAS